MRASDGARSDRHEFRNVRDVVVAATESGADTVAMHLIGAADKIEGKT